MSWGITSRSLVGALGRSPTHEMHSPFVIVVTAEYAGPKVVSILVWNIDRKNGSVYQCSTAWILTTSPELVTIYEYSLHASLSFICGYCDFSGGKVFLNSNFSISIIFSKERMRTWEAASPCPVLTYPVSVFWSSDAWCATGETIEASVLVWAHNPDQHLLVMGSLLCGRKKTKRES